MTVAVLAAFLIATNATPQELVASCRTMIPSDVELRGHLVLRSRKGIVKAEHDYVLVRSNAVTRLAVDGKPFAPGDDPGAPIMGTDVTWSDLTLDYLWWDDFSFDAEKELESVHGIRCAVVVMKKGGRSVRIWIDRKTGALMQAEEFAGGRAIRRLWGSRVKKFGDRWVANVMEVETVGSGHRTKIKVEEIK